MFVGSPSSLVPNGALARILNVTMSGTAGLWTFDTTPNTTTLNDTAFVIAGEAPSSYNVLAGNVVIFNYPTTHAVGSTWTIATVPTQVSVPGKLILAPQSGVTI